MIVCLRWLAVDYLLREGFTISDPGPGRVRRATRDHLAYDLDPACTCCPAAEHPNYRRLREAA